MGYKSRIADQLLRDELDVSEINCNWLQSFSTFLSRQTDFLIYFVKGQFWSIAILRDTTSTLESGDCFFSY